MIDIVRKSLGRVRRRFRVSLYGNNQPLHFNLIHALNHRVAQRAWRCNVADSDIRAQAVDFAKQGYLKFSPTADRLEALSDLAVRVDRVMEDPRLTVPSEVEVGIVHLKDPSSFLSNLETVLIERIQRVVQTIYRSDFQITMFDIYRVMPAIQKDEGSYLWHCDNWPLQSIKFITYLDPTTRDTGAFRVKPLALSRELKKRGFWDRSINEHFAEWLEDESSTGTLEGQTGTSVLFQNSGCIHRASRPLTGHRDVVAIDLIPSRAPWKDMLERYGVEACRNRGVCRNPLRL